MVKTYIKKKAIYNEIIKKKSFLSKPNSILN